MEISIKITSIEFQKLTTFPESEVKNLGDAKMFIMWRRGKSKQYSSPIKFNRSIFKQGSEISINDTDCTFNRVGIFKINKKGEMQSKNCSFKLFISNSKKKLSHKDAMFVIGQETLFDMSSMATQQ